MNTFLLFYVFFAGVTLYPVFSFVKNRAASSDGKISEMDTLDIFMTLLCTCIGTIAWPVVVIVCLCAVLKKILKVLDV